LKPSEHTHLTIKALAEDDRPREKLVLKGRQSLSDAELLAILLSSGNKEETAIQLAQRILNDNHNSINQLAKLQLNDLKKFKGVGKAKAVSILAALEIGRRRTDEGVDEKMKVNSSAIAYKLLKSKLSDLPHEEFWVLLVNRAHRVIKKKRISEGGVSGTVADPKIIFKMALEELASGVVVAHNHPSGNLQPSQSDIDLTKKLKEAGKFLEVQLLDHLIIAGNKYYSFTDEGVV